MNDQGWWTDRRINNECANPTVFISIGVVQNAELETLSVRSLLGEVAGKDLYYYF